MPQMLGIVSFQWNCHPDNQEVEEGETSHAKEAAGYLSTEHAG